MKCLNDFLNLDGFIFDDEYNSICLDRDHFTPGYLTALAGFIKAHNVPEREFHASDEQISYLRTIGFHRELWQIGDNINRVNCGRTYSPLTPLKSPGEVDLANTTINNCIRELVNHEKSEGIASLLRVVGELHDNVWSHGKSTGFSMAQRTKIPNTNGMDHYIEFALADKGLGFLEELKRARIEIKDHQSAIEWCIQEGNSSKLKNKSEDDWTQRLPDDLIGGDPMMGFGGEVPENNHQGLGLAHLIKLIIDYKGELQLCTGNALLLIDSSGKRSYKILKNEWKGVAISCRFKMSELRQSIKKNTLEDSARKHIIMERLRGVKNDQSI
ncbi:hypothetical protein [Acinetobacter baumannii]|uniref:hypothetical protein n=1 Tax=Acinetobacter baumannii TaxID=470 RepID=UPI0004494A71|nr:hypothetical protein [Acinetobacter baumannii]EXB28871.1 hypothetical protein J518_3528 [Acinetobacter baumannii 1419130]